MPVINLTDDEGFESYLVTKDVEHWLEVRQVFFEAGVILALFDALYFCRKTDHPLPIWVVDGAIAVVGDRLRTGKSKGKGPKSNDATASGKDRAHFQRWLAVRKVMKAGEALDNEIYNKAKPLLAEVDADCSEWTIKRSYWIVDKDMKDPKNARKYYSPLDATEKMLGYKQLLKGVTFLDG